MWDDKFQINREISKPPPSLFIPVGYDRDHVLLNNPHADGSVKKSSLKGSKKSRNNEIEEEKKSEKVVEAIDDKASHKTASTNASSTKGSESG
jgi:hypothetical protein